MSEVLLIAGEPSGEEHALTFLLDLKKMRPDLKFWGVGGDVLKSHEMELLYHLKDFSSMGFTEVVGKIGFYKDALNRLTNEAIKRGTKDAVLIDFQDFNLRLAQRLSKNGVRVWYYVAPQAWAWRPWRAKTLAKTVHRLFTILPFEKDWFQSRGVKQLTPISHPLVLSWGSALKKIKPHPWIERLNSEPRLMLLPGSRRSEVLPLLPVFVQTAQALKLIYPRMHVTMSRVGHLDQALYDSALGVVDQWITPEQLPEHLLQTDIALAASGTVTLGTGMMGVPTVVTYRSSLINEFVVRKIIGYNKPVSLTNLVLDKMVFPEFLQSQVQVPLLKESVVSWLSDPQKWNATVSDLAKLPELLSGSRVDVADLMAKEMT
jgi:lipid-A-disaccharide synthase